MEEMRAGDELSDIYIHIYMYINIYICVYAHICLRIYKHTCVPMFVCNFYFNFLGTESCCVAHANLKPLEHWGIRMFYRDQLDLLKDTRFAWTEK